MLKMLTYSFFQIRSWSLHRGSNLKRVKHINPSPIRPDGKHYRDIKCQNEWLRQNIFDVMGNYLFCFSCIHSAFHISKQRLAQQRNVKRQASTTPLIDLKKSDIEQQTLSQYIIMSKDLELSFKTWWKPLSDTSVVQVRYPYEYHGNALRESNSSKRTVRDEFLSFIDANNQPNGRSADSSGPTPDFVSGFTTIPTPKKNVANDDERLRWSVNFRVQSENGKGGCFNGSASNRLSQYRPKVEICPHKLDLRHMCKI